MRTQLRQYVGKENNRENDRRPPMSDSLRGFLWGVACLLPVPDRPPPPCFVIMGLGPLLIEIERNSVGLRYNAVESRARREHCGHRCFFGKTRMTVNESVNTRTDHITSHPKCMCGAGRVPRRLGHKWLFVQAWSPPQLAAGAFDIVALTSRHARIHAVVAGAS